MQAAEIEIHTGDHPRLSPIVVTGVPGTDAEGTLTGPDGKQIPFQRRASGEIIFHPGPIEAGKTLRYRITENTAAAQITATKQEDQIVLGAENKPAAIYQTVTRKNPRPDLNPLFLRGGYLHPLFSPSGKSVTDDYALNHLHHHGIWTAWTKTSFDGREPDFWNMGGGKGKVDFSSLEKTWNGPVEAGLIAKHKHTDLTGGSPVDVLDETWTVRTYAGSSDFNLIDLESSQTCATDKPLLLPVYHYGSLGIRGREEWNGKDQASFVISEKFTDRRKANGQPARWISMTGNVDGGKAGLAVLSHPENFRSPQPVRIHPDEPFISFAPQTNEAMSIQPRETYRMKYRLVVFDGEPDAKLIESLWQDYAHPAKAEWKE